MKVRRASKEFRDCQTMLQVISRQKHEGIPIGFIMDELRTLANLTIIQEDGTPWEGFFCGCEGSVNMVLADAKTLEPVDNSRLALQWYKDTHMTKHEVNAYLS